MGITPLVFEKIRSKVRPLVISTSFPFSYRQISFKFCIYWKDFGCVSPIYETLLVKMSVFYLFMLLFSISMTVTI